MQAKAVFIVPGFRHNPKNKAYKTIARMLKKQGYHPILVDIPWKQTTISQNTEYFLKEYKKIKAKEKYILGFSFGAMIAFIASTKVNVSSLILCSLSPYFKEDIKKTKNKLNSSLKTKRHNDFLSLNCKILAKQIKAKQVLMLYGKEESKPLIKRATDTFYQIPSIEKYLISVKNTKHNIGDYRYLETINYFSKVLI